ncbi:hypothetical protein [Ligilactobacillus salivarius]|uniref:hypothetical protein n=1 Tax=Ligilactobacillus salivarius TaxID=1624 RepID=UPI00136A3E5C|nr:hypothetical protein [Ligilactobacillus salivarius]MYV09871.1 hypothetical protein [Ligilactobacillus salivarius]MYZ21274.1 hypothetical protein [Ligilactobacillus salivarius]
MEAIKKGTSVKDVPHKSNLCTNYSTSDVKLLSRRIRFRRGVNRIIENTENKQHLLVFLETTVEIESSYDKENAKWLLDKYRELGGKHDDNED